MRHLVVVVLKVLIGVGVFLLWPRSRQRVPEPDLAALTAPPVNFPRAPRPAPVTAQVPGLPGGSVPGILVLVGGTVFTGELVFAGELTVGPGEILARRPGDAPVEIRFRPPTALPAPPPFIGPGEVTVRIDEGPPRSRAVTVTHAGGILLSLFEGVAPDPLSWQPVPGIRVSQRAVPKLQEPGLRAAPALLEHPTAGRDLPVGQTVIAPLPSQVLQLYATVSARERIDHNESGTGDRYILRVWITGG